MKKRRSSKQAAPGVTFTDVPRTGLSPGAKPIGRDLTARPLPIEPFQHSRLGPDIGAAVSEAQRDLRQERPNTSRALGALATLASGEVRVTSRKGAKK